MKQIVMTVFLPVSYPELKLSARVTIFLCTLLTNGVTIFRVRINGEPFLSFAFA